MSIDRPASGASSADDDPIRPPEPSTPPSGDDSDEQEPAGDGRVLGLTRTAALFLAIGVLATLTLLWSAAENHYQSCVQAVDARYGAETDNLSNLARREGVDDCSRLP